MNKSHCIVYGDLAANCIFGKESRKTFKRARQAWERNKQHFHFSSRCTSLFNYCWEGAGCEPLPRSFSCWFGEPPSQSGAWLWTMGHVCQTAGPLNASFFVPSLFQNSFSLLGFIQEAWVLRYTIARVLQRNTWCSIERNQANWLVWLSLTNGGNFRRLTTCKWGGK